jgi:GNAT superfamily N-acetyltransferase
MTRARHVVLSAYRALYDEVIATDGATVLLVPAAPAVPMLNRIVGLGTERPATESDVDAALALVPPGFTYYVSVDPEAGPRALGGWLRARGLEPGWGWMLFRRGVEPLPPARTSLTLREASTPDDLASFGHVVATSYGLPAAAAGVAARAGERGWSCWLALEGDEAVSAGGLFVAEGAGYLGFAGTLEEHRGKGAQGALLAARAERAAELGCDVLLTETGEQVPERPSNSYRNLLRAGFAEVEVTANWLGRS